MINYTILLLHCYITTLLYYYVTPQVIRAYIGTGWRGVTPNSARPSRGKALRSAVRRRPCDACVGQPRLVVRMASLRAPRISRAPCATMDINGRGNDRCYFTRAIPLLNLTDGAYDDDDRSVLVPRAVPCMRASPHPNELGCHLRTCWHPPA